MHCYDGVIRRSSRRTNIGSAIRFATRECWLGGILVAASEKGICAILLGDDARVLSDDLQRRFRTVDMLRCEPGEASFEQLAGEVLDFVATPWREPECELDLRGTAFQQRVWEALRTIPAGSTASYSEIAQQIGQPRSVRAVAQACGANPLAIAIPCHRVVRRDGSLSGYRWGVQRKHQLLLREQQAQLVAETS